jgi:hypothetical protein
LVKFLLINLNNEVKNLRQLKEGFILAYNFIGFNLWLAAELSLGCGDAEHQGKECGRKGGTHTHSERERRRERERERERERKNWADSL